MSSKSTEKGSDIVNRLNKISEVKKPNKPITKKDPIKEYTDSLQKLTEQFLNTIEKYEDYYHGDAKIKKAAQLVSNFYVEFNKLSSSSKSEITTHSKPKSTKKAKVIHGSKNQLKRVLRRYDGGDKVTLVIGGGDEDFDNMDYHNFKTIELAGEENGSDTSLADDIDLDSYDDSSFSSDMEDVNFNESDDGYDYNESADQEGHREGYTWKQDTDDKQQTQDENIDNNETNFGSFFGNYY